MSKRSKFTESQLKILGDAVGGHFYRVEKRPSPSDDLLVFGSDTFPSYRITVTRIAARDYLYRHGIHLAEIGQQEVTS